MPIYDAIHNSTKTPLLLPAVSHSGEPPYTRTRLHGEARGVEVMKRWPARSPDVHPPSNRCGRGCTRAFLNADRHAKQLEEFGARFFAEPRNEIDDHVRSFPRRLRECCRLRAKPCTRSTCTRRTSELFSCILVHFTFRQNFWIFLANFHP